MDFGYRISQIGSEEKMKALTLVLGSLMAAILIAACQIPGTKIKPGDKIGEMEFINVWEDCQAPNFTDICGGFETLEDGTCEIPADLTKFWVSRAWAEDTQEALELAWQDSKWSMTFDGHAVDLDAFGSFDMDWTNPEGKVVRARAWNVCISDPAPGKHTVVYDYFIKNSFEWGNFTSTYTFTVLPP